MGDIICVVFYALEVVFFFVVAKKSYKEKPNANTFEDLIRSVTAPLACVIPVVRCAAFIIGHKLLFLNEVFFLIHVCVGMLFFFTCGNVLDSKKGIAIGCVFIVVAFAFAAWAGNYYKHEMIRRIKVRDSSCFSEIGYDSDSCDILVTFKDSGDTYIYDNDDELTWEQFKEADSLGEYYNEYIKGVYDCVKID